MAANDELADLRERVAYLEKVIERHLGESLEREKEEATKLEAAEREVF